jgi:hypothetical protein
MPVYNDLDRLGATIKNDLLSLIRKDSYRLIDQVANKLENVQETTKSSGNVTIEKTDKGAKLKANLNVSADNASDLIFGIDNAVKDTFRFGNWSDMRVS